MSPEFEVVRWMTVAVRAVEEERGVCGDESGVR